jgi:hypothetical protein
VVDPLPQAVMVNSTTPTKINVYFFITVNIQKKSEIKKPQQGCWGLMVFQWVQPHLLKKKRKGNRQREPLKI